MRILVCGSRDWDNPFLIRNVLSEYQSDNNVEGVTIINGGARGADTLAHITSIKLEYISISVPAQWSKYGDKAGPLRNQRMLDEFKPDFVIAFSRNDSPGTKDMINRATASGLKVEIYTYTT